MRHGVGSLAENLRRLADTFDRRAEDRHVRVVTLRLPRPPGEWRPACRELRDWSDGFGQFPKAGPIWVPGLCREERPTLRPLDSWHGFCSGEPQRGGGSITSPFDPLMSVMQEAADTLTDTPKSLRLGLWPEWSRDNGSAGCGPGFWMDVLHALARRSVKAGGILRPFEWRVCYPGPDLPHDDTGDGRHWPEGAMKLPPFPPRPDAPPDAAADWIIRLPDDADLYDPPAGLWEARPSRWYGFVPDAGRASAAACLLLAGWEPEDEPGPIAAPAEDWPKPEMDERAAEVVERARKALSARGVDPVGQFPVWIHAMVETAQQDLVRRGFGLGGLAPAGMAIGYVPALFDQAVIPALLELEKVWAMEAVTDAEFADPPPDMPDRYGRPLAESVIRAAERCFAGLAKTLAGENEEAVRGFENALNIRLAIIRTRMMGNAPFGEERAAFRREWETAVRRGRTSPAARPATGDRSGSAGDTFGDTGDTPKETGDSPHVSDPWPRADRDFIFRMVKARPAEQRDYIRGELTRQGFNVTDENAYKKRVETLRKNYQRTLKKLAEAGQL